MISLQFPDCNSGLRKTDFEFLINLNQAMESFFLNFQDIETTVEDPQCGYCSNKIYGKLKAEQFPTCMINSKFVGSFCH